LRRLLLDATTLASGIAGLAYRGPSARLIEELLAGTFETVLCPTLIDELSRALGKPYFAQRISAEQVSAALEDLDAISVLCADPIDPPRVLRDPNDDYLLALAASSGAEAIITGDKDLLDHPGLAPPAITARQALEQLGLS
jgi:putative PIN family toxin of toxin-antitoxin system